MSDRRPVFDVVVVDLDGGPRLARCVESIVSQEVRPVRLVLFDNGSSRPSQESLPSMEGIDLVVHRSLENLGFAAGVNRAMTDVTSPCVAWINNDVVLDRFWSDRMLEALEPDIGAVQSVILRDDRTIDGAGIDLRDGTIRQMHHGESSGTKLAEPWGVSATATMYRTAALRQVARGESILEERLVMYYEDVELCSRLHENGWRTILLPWAGATHEGSATASRLGARAGRLRTRNRYLVHRMHPEVGRMPALLAEDLRLLARELAGLRAGAAIRRVAAIVEGFTRPLSQS